MYYYKSFGNLLCELRCSQAPNRQGPCFLLAVCVLVPSQSSAMSQRQTVGVGAGAQKTHVAATTKYVDIPLCQQRMRAGIAGRASQKSGCEGRMTQEGNRETQGHHACSYAACVCCALEPPLC
jgi:hypothetical protein